MFVRGNMLSVINADAHSVSNKGLVPGDTVRVGGRKKGGWLRVRCSRTGAMISIRSGSHLCLASKVGRPVSQIDLLIREKQLASTETRVQILENCLDEWNRRGAVLVAACRSQDHELNELRDECATFKQQWSDRQKYVEYLEAELAETGQNSKNEIESLERDRQELCDVAARWRSSWEEAEEVQIDNKKEIESLERQLAIAHRLLDEATKQNAELLDERSVLQEKLKKREAEFAEWRADMGWVEVPPGSAEWMRQQAAEALLVMKNGC